MAGQHFSSLFPLARLRQPGIVIVNRADGGKGGGLFYRRNLLSAPFVDYRRYTAQQAIRCDGLSVADE
jgi:hypothetical protein